MTDENKENNFAEFMSSLNSKLDDSLKEVKSTISSLETKIETKEKKPIKDDDDLPKFSWENDEEEPEDKGEDRKLTVKDLKSFEKILDKKIEKTSKETASEIISDKEKFSRMAADDQLRAQSEFPELKDSSSELYKETLKQIALKKEKNPNAEKTDPDLVFDAASRAMIKLQKEGRYVPNYIKEKLERSNRLESSDFFIKSSPSETKTLTPRQKEIASAFGISPERHAQLQSKYMK